jgi:hypothetical protein
MLPRADLTLVAARCRTRELAGVQVYGHPWVMGEYWPMITPCFQVRAVDDAGNEHVGMPGDWQGFPGNVGSGSCATATASQTDTTPETGQQHNQ